MICPKPCHNSHDLSRILQRSWCFFLPLHSAAAAMEHPPIEPVFHRRSHAQKTSKSGTSPAIMFCLSILTMFMGEAWRNPSINAGFMLSPAVTIRRTRSLPASTSTAGIRRPWDDTNVTGPPRRSRPPGTPNGTRRRSSCSGRGWPRGENVTVSLPPKMAVRFFVIIDEHICGAETSNQQLYQLVFGVQCCTVLCFPCQFWSGSTWLS